jgi:hypothetical protein
MGAKNATFFAFFVLGFKKTGARNVKYRSNESYFYYWRYCSRRLWWRWGRFKRNPGSFDAGSFDAGSFDAGCFNSCGLKLIRRF